jgi:hypothetical protein
MSGLSARCVLLAVRASSVAVTVGSAIDRSGRSAFGRLPARDLVRAEAMRARAVAPVALASEVRLRADRRPVPAAVDFDVVRLLLAPVEEPSLALVP